MWLRHSNQPFRMWKNRWNLAVMWRKEKKRERNTFADWLHKGALLPFTSSTTVPSDFKFNFSLLPDDIIHEMNEIMLFLIRLGWVGWGGVGVLTTAPPNLFLVKISCVIQGAVPPLCLQHTGSLLISYLSGEAVIIWGWASTMDNYPGRRILTVEKILLSMPEYIKTLAGTYVFLFADFTKAQLWFGPSFNKTIL